VETLALSQVSLSIEAGEFVAIMGPSGCGKSTLMNVLGLLDSPTSGSFSFFGEEVAGLPEARLTRLRREHIGFVFQSFNLIDDLTVAENVEVALLYRGVGGAERKRRVARRWRRSASATAPGTGRSSSPAASSSASPSPAPWFPNRS
jgi:putative ABC transport system ATP-binding protein